ncbi:DUF6233 domain-containing protein [[Kitasatospora] papulosa]
MSATATPSADAERRSPGEQALAALAEGVDACTRCRPDTDLGLP